MRSTVVETFREEALELLAELEAALLELEAATGAADHLGRVLRALHTLKGAGAMAGFGVLAELVHEIESAFGAQREDREPLDQELIGLTLEACDRLRRRVTDPAGNDDILAELQADFRAWQPRAAAPAGAAGPEPGQAAPASATYRIRFTPPPDLWQRGLNPLGLLQELDSLGDCRLTTRLGAVPPLEELDPERCHLAFEALLTTPADENAIRDVFIFVAEESELSIERLDQTASPVPAPRPQAPTAGGARTAPAAAPTLRVRTDKLDGLVDLVGELVTLQARLNQLAGDRRDGELESLAESVERLTWDLRDQVLKVRMLPIGSIFGKFRRLVRDLGKELGKEVELTTEGGETELDKTLIDRIHEPLVHLIRNSIAHGIESPAERRAQGKPASGRIHLAASHSGAGVLVRVSDDGAGLDRAAIRRRAEELGLLAAEAELSDQEVQALIFNSGLSTAARVTNVSGRGVGMDAVRQTIDGLGGAIALDSQPGQGTTFDIRLPLTLAIIDGLLVKVADTPFVLPLAAVEECIELHRDRAGKGRERCLVDVRGEIVPFIRLRERFASPGDRPPIEQIVITRPEGRRVGIVVDQVIGGHQTVIKPLGAYYRQVPDFSGATILGDGRVAMILDLPRVVQGAEAQELAATA